MPIARLVKSFESVSIFISRIPGLVEAETSDRSQSDSLIVSCSNGNLSHLVADDTGELAVEQAWRAHDYEPWITAFDLWRPEVVWSGKTYSYG